MMTERLSGKLETCSFNTYPINLSLSNRNECLTYMCLFGVTLRIRES